MIIFGVQTNVELTNKPNWLDSYRSKYDNSRYDYHVTLKQACIIEKKEIEHIRKLLSQYFKKEKIKSIPIQFSELILAEDRANLGDACIMIKASKNDAIFKLQKDIVEILSEYKNYFWPEAKEYEEKFMPHITIARDLDIQKFDLAKKDLKDDYLSNGMITKVMLSVVYNFNTKGKRNNYHDDSEYKLERLQS